jgi:hypothetical protein
VLEAVGHLRVALQQPIMVAAVVVGGLREPVLYPVLLLLQRQQLLEGEDDLVVDRTAVVDDAVLGEVADGRVRGHADRSGVGLLEAREHAEQRRLARAVGARQSDPVPLLDVPRDVLEEDLLAVTLGQALDVDH